ncbi:MAG: DoxX family protein [Anaerolineales bacterium]
MATKVNDTRALQFVKELEDPPVAKALFGNVKWAWIWLLIRLYAGYEWLVAGFSKIQSPAWTGDNAGAALRGFVNGALEKTSGAHPDVQGWYATFLRDVVLPNAGVWSKIIAYGELLVAAALILGIFTGITAFFGGFMNMNYLLSGSVSTNPVLLAFAILLVLAWKTAGWWGLDRWLLPALGTPWRPGLVFHEDRSPSSGMQHQPSQP